MDLEFSWREWKWAADALRWTRSKINSVLDTSGYIYSCVYVVNYLGMRDFLRAYSPVVIRLGAVNPALTDITYMCRIHVLQPRCIHYLGSEPCHTYLRYLIVENL